MAHALDTQAIPVATRGEPSPPAGLLRIRVRARPALARRVVQPLALHTLGVTAAETGHLDDAAELLARAVGYAPDRAPFLVDLGRALWLSGDAGQAAACFRRAILADASGVRARLELSRLLFDQGDYEEAASCAWGVLALLPGEATSRSLLGRALYAVGRLEPAARALRVATRLNPTDARAWADLGSCYQALGQLRTAERCLSRALRFAPHEPGLRADLGWWQLEARRPGDAFCTFREVLRRAPDSPDALAGLAEVQARQGHLVQARRTLPRDLDAQAGSPRLVLTAARVLARTGQVREAAGLVEAGLARPLPAPERALLHLARGDLLEALDQPAAALAAWSKGRTPPPRPFEAAKWQRDVEALIGFFAPEAFKWLAEAAGTPAAPAFVVGLPGAGVERLAGLLEAHPGLQVVADPEGIAEIVDLLPPRLGLPYPDCLSRLGWSHPADLAVRYLRQVGAGAAVGARLVDTTAQNFLHLGLIALLFPRARVVHVVRSPGAQALSALRSPATGPLGAASHTLADIRRHAAGYRRLMQHWHKVLPVPMLELSYETLGRRPEDTLRQVLDFLGVGWDTACLPAARTLEREAALPHGEGSVEGWRAFSRWLEPEVGDQRSVA